MFIYKLLLEFHKNWDINKFLIKIPEKVGQTVYFTLRLATAGKNAQTVRYILYNRKLSFSNGGR